MSPEAPLFVDEYRPTIADILQRMRTVHGDSEVISRTENGTQRARYAEVGERVDRLCTGLDSLGVTVGTRAATFAWNSQEHFEVYLGVPSMGALLHTLNIRLDVDQIVSLVNEAEDRVLFVDASLVGVLAPVMHRLASVRSVVIFGEADANLIPGAVAYEDLLGANGPGFDYPPLDERLAAGLCYTSGTTGPPKGVLYSHRAHFVHSLAAGMADTFALSSADRVMPVVPMFHGAAWGLPYAAALHGCDLVLPGPRPRTRELADLIGTTQVTVAAAVPTIWGDLLDYADAHSSRLDSIRLGVCGGVSAPLALMRNLQHRHAVRLVQAWGMTEIRVGAVGLPVSPVGDEDWVLRETAGRLAPGVEARLINDAGVVVQHDGVGTGEIQVRGPWISTGYFLGEAGCFQDGWLKTGDIASIDPRGIVSIRDRAKDLIKSGGEWIPSVAIEQALLSHPDVVDAAVIARPDARFSERPLACVVFRPTASAPRGELQAHLRSRMVGWWVPESFAVLSALPRTSVGKTDKKRLRQLLAEGELPIDGF